MTRELFVSSTPHETKVGLVEDDLLAEIYLERENEYTLAGSIYKGRVTRVLPGMQSAFVDIGLERDAFLYVSDFMELEDSEDLDEVPANRPAPERYQAQPQAEAHGGETFAAPAGGRIASPRNIRKPGRENREAPASGESRDNRGGLRGRRRRRGRRGERMPESKFASPATEAPHEAPRAERPERPNGPNAPNGMIGPSGRNFPIAVDDPNARRERTGPSAPNTDRRRDISPSFCPESPSPNIEG